MRTMTTERIIPWTVFLATGLVSCASVQEQPTPPSTAMSESSFRHQIPSSPNSEESVSPEDLCPSQFRAGINQCDQGYTSHTMPVDTYGICLENVVKGLSECGTEQAPLPSEGTPPQAGKLYPVPHPVSQQKPASEKHTYYTPTSASEDRVIKELQRPYVGFARPGVSISGQYSVSARGLIYRSPMEQRYKERLHDMANTRVQEGHINNPSAIKAGAYEKFVESVLPADAEELRVGYDIGTVARVFLVLDKDRNGHPNKDEKVRIFDNTQKAVNPSPCNMDYAEGSHSPCTTEVLDGELDYFLKTASIRRVEESPDGQSIEVLFPNGSEARYSELRLLGDVGVSFDQKKILRAQPRAESTTRQIFAARDEFDVARLFVLYQYQEPAWQVDNLVRKLEPDEYALPVTESLTENPAKESILQLHLDNPHGGDLLAVVQQIPSIISEHQARCAFYAQGLARALEHYDRKTVKNVLNYVTRECADLPSLHLSAELNLGNLADNVEKDVQGKESLAYFRFLRLYEISYEMLRGMRRGQDALEDHYSLALKHAPSDYFFMKMVLARGTQTKNPSPVLCNLPEWKLNSKALIPQAMNLLGCAQGKGK